MLADELVIGRDPVGDREPNRIRNADSSGFGQRLEAGRHVDAFPLNLVLLFDRLAAADTDAKTQAPRAFQFRVHRTQLPLYRQRGGQRVCLGIESCQYRIPVRRRDASASLGDSRGDQLQVAAQGLPGRVPVQAVVAGKSRVQDRGDLARRRYVAALGDRARGSALFQFGEKYSRLHTGLGVELAPERGLAFLVLAQGIRAPARFGEQHHQLAVRGFVGGIEP